MHTPTSRQPCPTSPPRLMRAAVQAANTGYVVFPLRPRSKKPAVREWETTATRDLNQIRTWWHANPYNIGIACGPSRILVVDLDSPAHTTAQDENDPVHGQDVLTRVAAEHGAQYPAETYTVRTPTNGVHLYFHAPEPELRSRVGCWSRVDTRGAGGYVVAAGSVTSNGRYRTMHSVALAALPEWLVAGLAPPSPPEPRDAALPAGRAKAYAHAVLHGETTRVATASTGQRHDTLLRAAGRLGQLVGSGTLDEHTAETALHSAAQVHIGHDGFTASEATRTIHDGLTWGRARPRHIEKNTQ